MKMTHAVTSTGVQNFTYDASGNMLTATTVADGTVRYLAWDDENRLISVVDPAAKTEFAYDHSGMRVLKSGANGTVQYVSTNYTVRNNVLLL
ncbi:MAG: RHS repeat domain-containing protein [Spirochaetota bacterium]